MATSRRGMIADFGPAQRVITEAAPAQLGEHCGAFRLPEQPGTVVGCGGVAAVRLVNLGGGQRRTRAGRRAGRTAGRFLVAALPAAPQIELAPVVEPIVAAADRAR